MSSVWKTNLVLLTRQTVSNCFSLGTCQCLCPQRENSCKKGVTAETQLAVGTALASAILKWLWGYNLPSFTWYRHLQVMQASLLQGRFIVCLLPSDLKKILSVWRSDAWKNGHSSEQNWSRDCIRFRGHCQKQSSQHLRKLMTLFFLSFCSSIMLEWAAMSSPS